MLLLAWPRVYRDPRPPRAAATATTREDRVAIYARRHRRRLGLYHPDDSWRRISLNDRAAIQVSRKRNGCLVEHGALSLTDGDWKQDG